MENPKNQQSDNTLNTQSTDNMVNTLGTENIDIQNQYAVLEFNYTKYIMPYVNAVKVLELFSHARELNTPYNKHSPPELKKPNPINISFMSEDELSTLTFLSDLGINSEKLDDILKANKVSKYNV